MNRTSTEPAPRTRFRRVFAATVAVLVLLCGVLFFASSVQGPKISHITFDASLAVKSSTSQLTLFANQPVADILPEQVAVTPSVPVAVEVVDDAVRIRFLAPLRADTAYTVDVADVAARYGDARAAFRYEFATPALTPLFLDRADPAVGGDDVIRRIDLKSGLITDEFASPGIVRFGEIDHVLVVQLRNEDAPDEVALVNRHDMTIETLELPGPGTVTGLSTAGRFVTFAFTEDDASEDSEYLSALMRVDLDAAHTVVPVSDVDGSVIESSSWVSIPGTSAIVALNSDGTLLRVDLSEREPLMPLGTFEWLGRISADGARIIAGSAFDSTEVSLRDGSSTPYVHKEVDGEIPFGGDAWPLAEPGHRVQKATHYDFETNRAESFVLRDDGQTSAVVVAMAPGESLGEISVSPNSQYVAVEVTPSGPAVSDGYYPDARAVSVVTRICDLQSGALVREFSGSSVIW